MRKIFEDMLIYSSANRLISAIIYSIVFGVFQISATDKNERV